MVIRWHDIAAFWQLRTTVRQLSVAYMRTRPPTNLLSNCSPSAVRLIAWAYMLCEALIRSSLLEFFFQVMKWLKVGATGMISSKRQILTAVKSKFKLWTLIRFKLFYYNLRRVTTNKIWKLRFLHNPPNPHHIKNVYITY